tara:strand:- start:1226 stop:1480 length:255 start_codon:yes stop_codon:yes gene_type:complete
VQSYLDELPSAADFETALQQMNKSLKSKNVGMSALTILVVLIEFFVVNVMDSMLVVLQSVVCNKLIAKVAFILLILAMKPALTY